MDWPAARPPRRRRQETRPRSRIAASHSRGPPVAKLVLTIAEGLPCPPSLGHCRAKQLVVNWVVAEAVEDLMGGIVTLLVTIYLVGIGVVLAPTVQGE